MKFITLLAILSSVLAFQPATRVATGNKIAMSMKPNIVKQVGAVLLGSLMIGTPVLAKEGAGAKFSFFGDSASTPFTLNENREDPIYSPYSPYGDGTAAAYNDRKGGKEEVAFYSNKLAESM